MRVPLQCWEAFANFDDDLPNGRLLHLDELGENQK